EAGRTTPPRRACRRRAASGTPSPPTRGRPGLPTPRGRAGSRRASARRASAGPPSRGRPRGGRGRRGRGPPHFRTTGPRPGPGTGSVRDGHGAGTVRAARSLHGDGHHDVDVLLSVGQPARGLSVLELEPDVALRIHDLQRVEQERRVEAETLRGV